MNVDWMFALTVLVTGVLVVFLVLVSLVVLIMLMGKVVGSFGKQGGSSASGGKASPQAQPAPKAAAPVAKPQPKPAMQTDDGIGDEVIAVISAAIAAIMQDEGVPAGSYTVKSVKRAREARPAWAMAGMQQNTRPF